MQKPEEYGINLAFIIPILSDDVCPPARFVFFTTPMSSESVF